MIGAGGFGKVNAIYHKNEKRWDAMKTLSKHRALKKKQAHYIMAERNLLATLHNPFLVNMKSAFQDEENCYIILEACLGGDLTYAIDTRGAMKESQVKFYIACLLKALEYLHSQNILHRDIKPGNMLLDENVS